MAMRVGQHRTSMAGRGMLLHGPHEFTEDRGIIHPTRIELVTFSVLG